MCYAGTTPDKGQETVDVIIREFNKLSEGITDKEIQRAKVGLKSSLVMQSESSGHLAGANGSDYHILGRVRSIEEIKSKVEQTSVDSVTDFLRRNKFDKFTAVTIGPESINMEA